MVSLDDLKPTKRDVAVAVGSIAAYKLLLEKWVAMTKSRIEAYLDEREERREKLRARYIMEAQKEMMKELIPDLYQAMNQKGRQGGADA